MTTEGILTPAKNTELWWKQARTNEKNHKELLNYEELFRKTLKMTVKEYLKNCSLSGKRCLVSEKEPKYVKIFWLFIGLSSYSLVMYIVYMTISSFWASPTVMNLKSYQYKNVQFPGVAICNVNKISRKAAYALADKLLEEQLKRGRVHERMKREYLVESIAQFGRLIDFQGAKYEQLVPFIELFHDVYKNYTFGTIEKLMNWLSPQCSDLLVKCRWHNFVVNCSEYFRQMVTNQGHCCLFNYGTRYTGSDLKSDRRQRVPGFEYGLSLVLNTNESDYAYPLCNTVGFNILVFNGDLYPAKHTGAVQSGVVPFGKVVHFHVEANTVSATRSTRIFSVDQLKCLFSNAMQEKYRGFYSWSECIIRCRIRILLNLCSCYPYFYHTSKLRVPECSLPNVPCLSKYKDKISTLWPGDGLIGLEDEQLIGMYCSECYSDCAYVKYFIKSHTHDLVTHVDNGTDFYSHGMMRGIKPTKDTSFSIMHLYFPRTDTTLYQMDTVYYWFDLMCNSGGIASLFFGFSLMSVFECFYFMCCRSTVLFRANRLQHYY